MNSCPKCGRGVGHVLEHICRTDPGRHAEGYLPEPRPYAPRHCACDHCWDAYLAASKWADGVVVTDHLVETVADA